MHRNGLFLSTEAYLGITFQLEFIQRIENNVYILRNGPDACHYLCEHSDCEVAVVENRE
jgi:hypothetical protein